MPQPHAPDPNPRATILSRKIFATMSPSPANKAFVEHISAHTGNLPSESLLRPYFVNSAAEPHDGVQRKAKTTVKSNYVDVYAIKVSFSE